MENRHIRLRRFRVDYIPAIAKLCNNRKIWENVRDIFPHPYSENDARLYIDICMKKDTQMTFAIAYKGQLAGSIGLVPQSDVYRLSAEVGFWIGEPFWGKGIATQALLMISEYAFSTLKLIRLYANVFEHYAASRRVMEKAGFTLEGIFVKSVIKDNKLLNEKRYSLINSNYK